MYGTMGTSGATHASISNPEWLVQAFTAVLEMFAVHFKKVETYHVAVYTPCMLYTMMLQC